MAAIAMSSGLQGSFKTENLKKKTEIHNQDFETISKYIFESFNYQLCKLISRFSSNYNINSLIFDSENDMFWEQNWFKCILSGQIKPCIKVLLNCNIQIQIAVLQYIVVCKLVQCMHQIVQARVKLQRPRAHQLCINCLTFNLIISGIYKSTNKSCQIVLSAPSAGTLCAPGLAVTPFSESRHRFIQHNHTS